MEDKKIVLTVYKQPQVSDVLSGVVRITSEAEQAVKAIQRETGLSARYIVSEVLVQAADLIEIKEV